MQRHLLRRKSPAEMRALALKRAQREAELRALEQERIARIEAKAHLTEARNERRRQKEGRREIKQRRKDLKGERRLRKAALSEEHAQLRQLSKNSAFERRMARAHLRLAQRRGMTDRLSRGSEPATNTPAAVPAPVPKPKELWDETVD